MDEFDVTVDQMGWRSFLCRSQLEEIITNLKLQRAEYSHQELVSAIDYYWTNDAFIDLSNRGA